MEQDGTGVSILANAGGPAADAFALENQQLRIIKRTVFGRALSFLVRSGTLDEFIVDEVISSYPLDALIRSLRQIPSPRIIDIGGHIGAFSVILAGQVESASIRVFEVMQDNYEIIRCNITLNRLEEQVVALHAGVAESSGSILAEELEHARNPENTGGATIAALESVPRKISGDGDSQVQIVAASALIDVGEHVDLLKIDCEGSEYPILYSLDAAALGRISRIVGEIHHGDCHRTRGEANGQAWTADALLDHLSVHFPTVATGPALASGDGYVQTFVATR